ncbi:hypothetical protein EMCRGX_G017631 [Ephydatia muelleri]
MDFKKRWSLYCLVLVIANAPQPSNAFNLAQWSLNLTEYSFTLFTSAPNALTFASLDCTKFSFTNGPFPTSTFYLTGCGGASLVSLSTVKIYLTPSDAIALQLNRNFGKSSGNVYYLVVATANNLLSATDTLAQISYPGIGAVLVTLDSIKPALTSFAVFDQNAGSFSLTFSKPIDVQTWNATSLLPGVLVFQNFLSVSAPADSFSVQQLTCPGCADGSNLTFVFPNLRAEPSETQRSRLLLHSRLLVDASLTRRVCAGYVG